MTPCCHKVALGGLARRLAFYKAVRDTTRDVLCLDAGDWSPPPDYTTVPRIETARFVADCMKTMGYHAWTPGEFELNLGTRELEKLVVHTGAPIVSANVLGRAAARRPKRGAASGRDDPRDRRPHHRA